MRLLDVFERGLGLGADQACLTDAQGRSLSYREVDLLSRRVANSLRSAGLEKGDNVILLSPNHLMTFVSVLGTLRSGGVWVPVNARNAIEESIHVVAGSDCRFLFLHSSLAPYVDRFRQALPSLKGMVSVDGPFADVPGLEAWANSHSAHMVPDADAGPDQVVAIRGSGGTTGLPKGVLNTNRMYVAMFANMAAAMPNTDRPVHLVVAPLTHAAGSLTFASMAHGGTNVIMRTTSPAEILAAIEEHKITQLFLPPTLIYKLLDHPDVRRRNLSSLKYLVYAAAPMSVERLREAMDVFGPVMLQLYGQAEAPFALTAMTPAEHTEAIASGKAHRLASCGRASPFVEVQIMSPEGEILGTGQPGEIVARGDLVMRGYYRNPEATEAALRIGWLHTGDIAYRDEDGYIYVVDRLKDLIISGGTNLSPNEIEQVLSSFPAVADCAVIGVPDPVWGEAVKAIVELKLGAIWSESEALAYCRERLGSVKMPKSIEVWSTLPRNAIGKVLKSEIREKFWQGQGRRV